MWAEWEREAGFRVLTCRSTNQRVQEHGDLAVFSHDVHTVRFIDGAEDEVFERETIVLQRDADTWTCIHEHLSDPKPKRHNRTPLNKNAYDYDDCHHRRRTKRPCPLPRRQ